MQIVDANLTPNFSLVIALAKIMAVFLATIFKDWQKKEACNGISNMLALALARTFDSISKDCGH